MGRLRFGETLISGRLRNDESDLLSKLCDFPDTKFRKSELSSRKRKRCASAAVALRKALISELMSLDNVQLMVCKANDAFASLSSYHADFGDLYEAVRAFISYHCQLSEANKELESNGCLQEDMAVHQDNLLAWLNQEAEALSGTTTSIAKARKNAAVLMTRIGKTRKLLKELEEKLAQKDMEIDDLEKEGMVVLISYDG
ncbi:hypothetical protein TorRG33x02_122110 [Trema orientale]|uniref:Uncharacterized protein n=1 Tax=Trema orientale TaxID=63057 RepID=A0A2P5F256_TREOI|nr:hypothetical protein TorRG33x02_122110 [Trema orientale]